MDHFFVDTGPGGTGDPDRYGRPDRSASAEAAGRVVLTALLDLTGAAILTVENNCADEVRYRNALLTAVCLS